VISKTPGGEAQDGEMAKRERRLYEQLYLIRRAEELIVEHYAEDEMKTPVHLSIGQEAIPVGVCEALGPRDRILGTYRSHALYLARTGETDAFFAEMYGRKTGVAGGKAGSMHLSSPAHGLLATSAVVASTIPLALGVAFSALYRGDPARVAVFFGDGATDEGVFWESINYASLRRLPILFVCEDNGLAIHSRHRVRHGYESIGRIVDQFDCAVYASRSTDAAEIGDLAREALRENADSGRPAFLHLECYRYVEHVGPRNDRDFQLGYRREEEFEDWKARDPVALMRGKLIRAEVPGHEIRALEAAIDARLRASIAKARAAEFPAPADLHEDVYA
jgi:pyruvate dehydrogenase E1 component alpha subunit